MNKRKDEIIEAFKIGYQSGHEETVEGTFGDPLDEAEDYFEDVEPKRHPDPNGVLPLTEEEREEFEEKFKKSFLFPIESIQKFDTYLSVNYKEENRYPQEDIIINIEAIIYLNNLFELEVDR